jgi:hypothetical protein
VAAGDGSCFGEDEAATGLERSFEARVRKLNLVIGCVGKDL